MGSFHFLYNFSVFKSLGFFLFTSFMFKCTSHFRPHCFRHISWCLFLWAFWLNCLLGSSLTRQKPLNVMGIASWMNSSHQRARCIEMEDGSSPAIPGHLQHSFLLPAALVVCIQLLLLNGAMVTPVTKCCWSCYCKVTLWQPSLLPCWGRPIWSFPHLHDSEWHHGIHNAALHTPRYFSLTLLTSGTEKLEMIPEALSRTVCPHNTSWPKIHTQRLLKKEKNHHTLLKFLTLYIP